MKKAIIYLSLTSLIAVCQSEATELVIRLNPAPQKFSSLSEPLKPKTASLWEQLEARELIRVQEVSRMAEDLQNLEQALAFMGKERDKEEATKESLQEMVKILQQEHLASRQHLNQVLNQKIPQNEPVLPKIQLSTQPLPLFHEGQDVTFYSRHYLSSTEGYGKLKSADNSKNELSVQQKQLYLQRKLIGDKAWGLLDGSNPALSQALLIAIQECAGQKVDIFYQGLNNFKLVIDGKGQKKAYKF